MGKKKGKGKKKGGKAKGPPVDPEVAAKLEREALARKACEDRLLEVKTRIEKESKDFNDFQQQREKLNYFWIVEKKNLEDKKSELRNKARELQDLKEKHHVEIKVYKQRVKHLLYEHQNELTQLKTEAETTLKLAQDEFRGAEAGLKKDKRSIRVDLKEIQLSHDDYLNSLKQDHDRSITLLRQEFERKLKEMHLKYEKKMRHVRQDLEAQRKADITRIEKLKDRHTQELMQGHEKAFADIKNYYTDITHNNLDLIKSLKEEVAQMKKTEQADEKEMFEIAQENKRMSEPLKGALQDVERLREELKDYTKAKKALGEVKATLLVQEGKLKAKAWDQEVLTQRFAALRDEYDQLYERYRSSITDVQQKAGFKNLVLERRLASVGEGLEKKEAQLGELLSQANLAPNVLQERVGMQPGQAGGGKLDRQQLVRQDVAIRDLQQELERVVRAHNNAIGEFEDKLVEYGIPVEEVGFRAVRERIPRDLV